MFVRVLFYYNSKIWLDLSSLIDKASLSCSENFFLYISDCNTKLTNSFTDGIVYS
jgi:hypothetical protein